MQKIKLTTENTDALFEIKKLIDEGVETMPTIIELSKRSGLNRDKFKKGFKQLFVLPVYRYHCKVKMEKAKQLLEKGDDPINEIAWALGYEHPSNFCIAFKKYSGLCPAAYRKRMVEGDDAVGKV